MTVNLATYGNNLIAIQNFMLQVVNVSQTKLTSFSLCATRGCIPSQLATLNCVANA